MFTDLLVLCVLACPTGQSAPATQAEASVSKLHQLPPLELLGMNSAPGVDLRRPLDSALLNNMEPDQGMGPPVALERAEHTDPIAFLKARLEIEGLAEDLAMLRIGDQLQVSAPEATQARIADLLDAMEQELLRPALVEAFLLPSEASAAVPAALLSAEEVGALLGKYEPKARTSTRTLLGTRARLGARRERAALADFDVDVAESGRALDPQIMRLVDGLEVGVLAQALPEEGRYLLRAWSRMSTPPRHRPLQAVEGSDALVQLAEQDSSLLVGAGVVEGAGGGLAFGLDEGLLLVRLRARSLDREATFVPIGALLAPALRPNVSIMQGVSPSGGLVRDYTFDDWESGPFLRDPIGRDAVRSLLSDLPSTTGAWLGHGLLMSEEPSVPQVQTLEQLSRSRNRTVCFEVRMGAVPSALAAQVHGQSLGVEEVLSQLPTRILVSGRPGDRAFVQAGSETQLVTDFNTEIAASAMAQDPIVRPLFEGVEFWAVPALRRDGQIMAWAQLVASQSSEQLERRAVRNQAMPAREGAAAVEISGQLDLPELTIARTREGLLLQPGRWTLLCTNEWTQGKSLLALVRADVR